MDLFNLYGMNSYYQTLAAAGGNLGSYIQGSYLPGSYLPGSYLSGSMMTSPELSSTYAKFADALQKAASERQAGGSGMVVLTQDALARIQKDPAYEQEVMNMLRKGGYGLRVIGGSDRESSQAEAAAKSSSSAKSSLDASESRRSLWEEQYGQNLNQARLGMRGSLADRLASNRAARLQERTAKRQEGST